MKNSRLLWRLSGWFLMAALFFGLGGGTLRAQTFKLVTDLLELGVGDEVLLVCPWNANTADYYVMTPVVYNPTATPTRKAVKVTVKDNTITDPDLAATAEEEKAAVIVLENNDDGAFALKDKVSGKYYATVSGKQGLTLADDPCYYTITSFGEGTAAGSATIYGLTDNRYVRYNNTQFLSYAPDYYASKGEVVFYRKDAPQRAYMRADETKVRYKIVPGTSLEESLVFKAGNLEHDVTVAVKSADAGRDAAVIEVNTETITVADATPGFDLDLSTANDLEEGEYTDIITLTSGDIKVEVTVKLVVKVADVYQLVKKVSKLKDGDVVLIVGGNGGAYYAMDAETMDGPTSKRLGVEVQVTGDAIVGPDIATTAEEENPCEITLVKNAEGKYAFQDKVNNKYIKSGSGSLSMADGASYFTVSVNEETGAVTVNPTVLYTTYMMRLFETEFKFVTTTKNTNDIYFYRKQVPEDLICHPVTMPADGGVTAYKNSVKIIWNASEDDPDNGYRVTVTGEGYNQTETTDGTEIEFTGLASETAYTYSIFALCGDGWESDPETGTFTTLPAGLPMLDIATPENNTVFTGDVDFTFTTEDFDLGDDSHLVKAEVKEKKSTTEEQANAPVLKRVYTNTNSLTISGLADGTYHVDLYMVEVRAKTEGTGNDTVVVGFDGTNYVHCDIEVKHPAVYFASKAIKINTFLGVEGSGKVKVTGWALPEGSTITLASDNANVSVDPTTLTQAAVMATGGAEITVKYNGAAANATATITATCNDITAPLAVNAVAKDTLVNLKAIYSRKANDTVMVRGKMVVTYKNNSLTYRVYVQDMDKENGASMVLYSAISGYASIAEGDVLENVAGRVEIYNGRYRFRPIQALKASEKNHAIYVDTMSLLEVRAKSTTYQAQNALVCIKDVKFKETGSFTSSKNYTLLQGKDTLVFRTEFSDADYLGWNNRTIPTYSLYATVFVGYDNGARVTARSWADMVEAPCLVPTDFSEEVSSNEAKMEWEGPASSYSVRYATLAADLESAEVKGVSGKSFTATGLTPLTTYYYQVKSVCRAGHQSDWSDVKSFTTAANTDPSVNMTSPVASPGGDKPIFTDSVRVSFRIRNVTLKADDTSARIVFSDGFTVDNYTDTVYKRAMPSGNYSVQVKLVKDNAELEPKVQTLVRYFSVDLPNVANPVFTPRAGRYRDSVVVTLSCATQGATIFYAKGEGEYTAYTAGEKIVIKETTSLKAYAAKERMDTSAVVPATYTIYSKLEPEGDLVFAENFNKSTKASTTDISNFGKVADMSGWTGANMYAEVGEIKGGSSGKAGKLVSREIDLSQDNGKYYVAFFARAFDNNRDSTKIRLTAGDQSVLVTGLDKKEMSEYVYMFNNGTAHTRLTFEALAASYNRFYLDSICVYQKLPEVPTIIAPATLRMTTVQGTPVTQTVTVRGKLLSENVAVTCPEGNFSVSPATLDKEAVMSEDGAEFTVTFNGAATDDVEITLTSGSATATVAVTATATEVGGDDPEPEITVVATLTMNTTQGTPVSEKVTVKGKDLAEDVTVTCPEGNFSVSPATLTKDAVMSEAGAELTVTFNGEVLSDNVEITLASGSATATVAVTATATEVVPGDECEAPTQLKATVADKDVTLTWEGAAEKYRVVVTLGEKEVCNELVEGKSHELKNLEAGVYAWKVASVCEDGEQAADGENFEVKEDGPISANEGAEGLAFRIYPNPTVGAFYVEVAEAARMEIFTVGGVMIRNAELTEGKNEIRLDRSGIYFVRLTGAHGAAVNRVIVR